MRLYYLLFISLTANSIAFAEGEAPATMCDAESQVCVPSEARDGACEHPSLVFNKQVQTFLYDGEYSPDYERRCILRTNSFATRHGDELRLTFRNGTARTYKDKGTKACEQGTSQSCTRYLLYDYFPEHGLFLIDVSYYEGGEWLLVRQLNGKEEKIVAPPWYSPDKKWLASVNWSEGPAGAPNGVDIVSTVNPALRSFHYRPKDYALFEFVKWDGNDRLAMKVTVQPQSTFPVEVVRENGSWHLKWPLPTPPP